jgi:shikimate dehydrogenase
MRAKVLAERALSAPVDAPGWEASPRAVLVGLIGSGIQASKSPALHEREGEAQGLRYLYRLVDLDKLGIGVEAIGELLAAAPRLGFAGFNITHPAKQAVIPFLDDLSPEAEAIGAVNTVIFDGGRRVGHNTDAYGFGESLRRFLPDARLDRVVQIGAGGAGAAVAHAILSRGAGTLTLVDLDASRAIALAKPLRKRFGDRVAVAVDPPSLADADGLINASPVGMARYPGMPVPEPLLHSRLWVADIVYTPLETELLRTARRLGCRTLAGGGMAVFQAVEAFRLFTGIAPDAARMLRHFDSMNAGADLSSTNHTAKGG